MRLINQGVRNAGDLIETFSDNRPLSELLKIPKLRFTRPDNVFVTGFCATDDETFARVTEYMREQLGISPSSVHPIDLLPENRNIEEYLLKDKAKLADLDGNVMVNVNGFEKLQGLNGENGYRLAHDYHQDLIEHNKDQFRDLEKMVFLITQIAGAKGDKAYDQAVSSACQGRFRDFLYEF
jgi:hypothetical protein